MTVFDPVNDEEESMTSSVLPTGQVWRNGHLIGKAQTVPMPKQESMILPQTASDTEERVQNAVLTQLGPAGYMLYRALQMLRDAPSIADLAEYLTMGEVLAANMPQTAHITYDPAVAALGPGYAPPSLRTLVDRANQREEQNRSVIPTMIRQGHGSPLEQMQAIARAAEAQTTQAERVAEEKERVRRFVLSGDGLPADLLGDEPVKGHAGTMGSNIYLQDGIVASTTPRWSATDEAPKMKERGTMRQAEPVGKLRRQWTPEQKQAASDRAKARAKK